MKIPFRLTLSILILVGFAGLAAAHTNDKQINIIDLAIQPEAFEGLVVQVRAQVIAINADSKSLELFDSQSKTLIGVRLTQLRRAERYALMRGNVRQVVVTGRATVIDGRLSINAQRVEAVPVDDSVAGS